jgi:DNA mismatch repair ATPase MutS
MKRQRIEFQPTKLRIASFDIGTRNFAIAIQSWSADELPDSIDTVAKQSICEHLQLIDLDPLETKSIQTILQNLTTELDKLRDLFDECDGFIVERQMDNKNSHNIKAVRIAHHTLSYFQIKYNFCKFVNEFQPGLRTKILGAERGLNHKQRKKWATNECRKILDERNDPLARELDDHKKADDLSDAVLQTIVSIWLDLRKPLKKRSLIK